MSTLSWAQGNLELALFQSEATLISNNELYVWLANSELPQEIIIRLRQLTTYTKKVGQKVFAVGKIILLKLIQFIKQHPHLVTGIGMGATLGLSVQYLVSSIPFIGAILAPVAGAISATLGIAILGIAGHRLDKRSQGLKISNGIIGIAEDAIEITKVFFEFIADVFNTVFHAVIIAWLYSF